MAAGFWIESSDDGVTVVQLHGEFDMANAPWLTARLGELDGDIVLDCSRVEFMDTTGVSALLRYHQRLARDGRMLTLRMVPAFPRHAIEMMGLDQTFNFEM